MPSNCSVCGYNIHSRKSDVKERIISMHKFPLSKPTLLKAWLDSINRKDFIPHIHSRICSDHFTADSFITASYHNRRLLKEGAVPTIFDFTKDDRCRKRYLEEMSNTNFAEKKKSNLQKIDLSRKGSIDNRILDLVNFINDMDCYVTTSSCSGRIIVFTNSELKKKGCKWLFTSHDDSVEGQNIIDALYKHTGSAILKFEPFVMHVRCFPLQSAQKLHSCCLESGFRNSGLTMGKKGGIVLAIRSTLSLEVPLSCFGKLLVSPEYITYVVNLCNEKMRENWNRTELLFKHIKDIVAQKDKTTSNASDKDIAYPIEIPHIKQECIEIEENKTNALDEFFDGFETLISYSKSAAS